MTSAHRQGWVADMVSVLVSSAVLALTLASVEYAHYAPFVGVPSAGVGTVMRLVIVGKTLVLMLPGLLAGVALRRAGRDRAGLAVAVLSALGVIVYLWLDLLTHEVTGNHLTYYMGFLREPDTWQWAGTPARVWALFRDRAGELALPAAGALAVSVGATALMRRMPTSPATVVALAAAWLVLLGGGPVIAPYLSSPVTFVRLDEVLPISWNAGFGTQVSALTEAQIRAVALYTRRFLPTRADVPPVPDAGAPRWRPHVVMLVLDGLRADLLNPTVMPRVWRWSERGARFETHYSNSNSSSGGMFSLVAGRYPLVYPEERKTVALALSSLLERDGYDNHFFTSSDLKWGGLERFLGPPSFTMHEDVEVGQTHERDTRNLAVARRLVDAAERPQFLVVFLMSSHWLYSYPERYADFDPDLTPIMPTVDLSASGGAAMLVRSVRFLDDLVGEWLDGLDAERTLVLVTGDHGESFKDDGSIFHGSRLSDVQTRVALAMVGPGVPAGRIERSPTEHVDIAPTILAAMGYPPEAWATLHGRPLFANQRGPGYATAFFRIPSKDSPRVIAFLSPDLRFSLRLGWRMPGVELMGKLDASGLPIAGDLDAREQTTFVDWFDDFVDRAGR